MLDSRQLNILAQSIFTNDVRFKVNKHSARHVFSAVAFLEEGAVGTVTIATGTLWLF